MVIETNRLTTIQIAKILNRNPKEIFFAIRLGESKYKNRFSVEIPQKKDNYFLDEDIEKFRKFFESIKNNEGEKQIWKWWYIELNEVGKRNKKTTNK